jgi:hypothetical protein
MSYVSSYGNPGSVAADGAMKRRFRSGNNPQPGLQPGNYPAWLIDFDNPDTYTLVSGQYGDSVKLFYGVVAPDAEGNIRIYTVSELASDDLGLGTKLMARVGAVNPGVEITEATDLGTLATEGWCMCEIMRDPKNNQYFAVKNVTALPAIMRDRMPEVVTGWDNAKNRVFVRLARPGDQRALAGGVTGAPDYTQADEIPF